MNSSRFPQARINPDSAIQIGSGAASLAFPRLRGSQSLYQIDTGQELRSLGTAMVEADGPLPIAEFELNRLRLHQDTPAKRFAWANVSISPTTLSRRIALIRGNRKANPLSCLALA
jgi:hypothetical protein